MFKRIWRIIRGFFGSIIGGFEDPEIILEQNIRDMRDKIPEINQSLAKAKGGILKLEVENKEYQAKIKQLTGKIKACLASGNRELASSFAVQLKREQSGLERNQEQVKSANDTYESVKTMRDRYVREMQKKEGELKSVLRDKRASDAKAEIADAFESFEVGGIDQTHDEMLSKLKSQSAEAEAKLAVASDSVAMQDIRLEEDAEKIEGMELLAQFEMEMGMGAKESAPATPESTKEKTIGPEISVKDPS
ncbi:PspA/IM30 family protein [Candidatus Riflebacteria bacterium]